jgi:hypothetical protein
MMISRQFLLLASLVLTAATTSAKEAKILSRPHHRDASHAEIEKELQAEEESPVESFTCTITGAAGQDQCDAAADDDGSKCVWCVLSNFGFCVSGEQADQFKQIIPTIDCDDSNDDDKPAPDDDDAAPGPLWQCLESKDEESCTDSCVWCDTKGGFGVCITPEAAEMADKSYWFGCKSDEWEDDYDYDEEEEDEEEGYEDWDEGEEDDYDDDYDEDGMHEFVVDTSCVLAGALLDPNDPEASSEQACFDAKDITGKPCEWCTVEGSPFRLCLSEPQAEVAEYVGAVCSGSDKAFEAEDFDDSCIAHMHADRGLTRQGCWQHMDLDGNGCEWCTLNGVELCLGGVQAELVEHWGATCVLDDHEHAMAQEAIQQHRAYIAAEKEARQAQKKEGDEEEEFDLASVWLTSDTSCMVTTLRTSNGDDNELACAQSVDANGKPCNWCQIGTMFSMCANDEQVEVAEKMGIECESISTDAQAVLKEHIARAQEEESSSSSGSSDEEEEEEEEEEEYEEGESDEDDEEGEGDFDTSCIMSMQEGPDQATCVSNKDQDGEACQWCTWNNFHVCLAAEQAEMVEPFGVSCDQKAAERVKKPKKLPKDFYSCLSQSASLDVCDESCSWCDLKKSESGAGLCLSDDIADLVSELVGDEILDCSEPEESLGDMIVDAVEGSIA